jgi:hypothetical protein
VTVKIWKSFPGWVWFVLPGNLGSFAMNSSFRWTPSHQSQANL